MILPQDTQPEIEFLDSNCSSAPARPEPASPENALQSIREARDRVLAINRELIEKVQAAEDRLAEITFERDDALELVARMKKAAEDLERRNQHLEEQIAADASAGNRPSGYEELITTLTQARDQAVAEREASLTQLAPQAEALAAAEGRAEAAEARVAELSAALEDTRAQLAQAQATHEDFIRLEEQRHAELVAQLAALQQERVHAIRERDTAVAEAGLRAEQLAAAKAPAPWPDAPQAADAAQTLDEEQLFDRMSEFFSAIEELKAEANAATLPESFEGRMHAFSREAEATGLPLVARLAAAAADLLTHLQRAPTRRSSAVPLLEKAVETMSFLTMREGPALNLDGAMVFAIDDDVDNCECIASALEKHGVLTKYTVTPEVALQQIAAHECALLILDVDLPRLDGFELYARIREMPGRATTPILFLSGHLSARERVAALQDERAVFVSKPYVLTELNLRILTQIAAARLG